jgi:hypothetical protein
MGASPTARLTTRLGALRHHRADAHRAAWQAAGLTRVPPSGIASRALIADCRPGGCGRSWRSRLFSLARCPGSSPPEGLAGPGRQAGRRQGHLSDPRGNSRWLRSRVSAPDVRDYSACVTRRNVRENQHHSRILATGGADGHPPSPLTLRTRIMKPLGVQMRGSAEKRTSVGGAVAVRRG